VSRDRVSDCDTDLDDFVPLTSMSAHDPSGLPMIDIVGLGPAGDEYVTEHTRQVISRHVVRYLRTAQHPNAHVVTDARTLDHHYESAATFDDVYRGIVEELVAAATEHGHIAYAVPGSPLILERTVQLLRSDPRVTCRIHPAMSFLDMVWSRLGIDPIEHAVRLVDAHDFSAAAAGESGALLIAHCHANWVLSNVKLAADDAEDLSNDDVEVVLLHHLGLEDEQVITVRWSEIDHTLEADHLTSLFVPGLRSPVGKHLIAFHELARRLRRECPWDREQTHRSLTTYLLEETYEVIDALLALDENDPSTDEDLMEELGDLLYQIEFHAAIAEQEGRFTMGDVARGIHDKMVRRHPHVFGERSGDDSSSAPDREELVTSWEEIKKAEKAAKAASGRMMEDSPFAGIVEASGSLAYASAILSKSAKAGHPVDLSNNAVSELESIQDLGVHLLHVVAECRRRKLDAEVLLREAAQALRRSVESEIRKQA
jgi:tetrapyrrole methylase family protein/MazG family protein